MLNTAVIQTDGYKLEEHFPIARGAGSKDTLGVGGQAWGMQARVRAWHAQLCMCGAPEATPAFLKTRGLCWGSCRHVGIDWKKKALPLCIEQAANEAVAPS
jgi:hypothetical protein